MKPEIVDVTEQKRLNDAREAQIPWKKWGPYLSERQWGTVREDYSEDGDAWNYFTHDHARSRAYRWGEDGLGGLCDDKQRLCFALALWNERDPILKERLFGLTNSEANHGEDVKEYYFYLDSTPTHSYMKYLYKYPQREYPYRELIETNRRRSREEFEYELLDTGIFNDDRYFDVFVEYAKESPEDMLVRITVHNRGPEAARLRVLPTLWFRNTWSWGDDDRKPSLREVGPGAIRATHHELGAYWFYCDGAPELLFTENESNAQRLWGQPNGSPYVKDAFHQYIIAGRSEAVNPAKTGTKAAAHYVLEVPGGGSKTVQLRLVAAATKDCLWRFREDVQKPHRRRRRILRPDFTQIAKRRSAPGASPGENEFFGPYGIRSLSRYHLEHPFVFHVGGQEYKVQYLPAESNTGMFGGNSNWRGPVWMPVNGLIVRALINFYSFYGDEFKVQCPTGSGKYMTLFEVAQELVRRLAGTFLRDAKGYRPVYGTAKFQEDPHWRDLILFYEYFHGDNGAGLGASHQTGWTALVAPLLDLFGRIDAKTLLETERGRVFAKVITEQVGGEGKSDEGRGSG